MSSGRERHAIQRLGPGDLMALSTDVGPLPAQVAAVLILDAGPSVRVAGPDPAGPADELAGLTTLLAERLGRIPRLRERLVVLRPGLGRPLWVPDGSFDAHAHITTTRCPAPGDRDALLRVAAEVVTEPLPRTRPLWRAVLVDGLPDGRVGLIVVVHHVVTDGLGGLAALLTLTDGAMPATTLPVVGDGPAPSLPTNAQLFRDNLAGRRRAVADLPGSLRRIVAARTELGARPGGPDRPKAPHCSLNAPVSGQLRVSVVEADLPALVAAAHRRSATVNDLLLVAVTACMESVLAARGEHVPRLVVSVPISARPAAAGQDLGNAVGVMPVAVPLTGSLDDRVPVVAALTAAQKAAGRGSSLAVLGPVLRALARLGLVRGLIEHQHLINSVSSNVRGPGTPVTLGGREVVEIIPITLLTGNVCIAFTALSYAGRLRVSVVHDPAQVPDSAAIAGALAGHLETLAHW